MPGFLAASERDQDSNSDGVQRSSILDESPSVAVGYVVDDETEHHWKLVGMQKAPVSCARNCSDLVNVEGERVLGDHALVGFDLRVEEYPYRRRRRRHSLAH